MPEGIKVGSAWIEVRADTTRAKEDLKNITKKASDTEADIQVGADTRAAASQIAYAARARAVVLMVKPVGLGQAEKAFARLSGIRTISDNVAALGQNLGNLDKTAPKIAKAAVAVGALSAATLAGGSNLLVLGGSLASMGPALLALPGMFMGAAIGAGVLKAALKDAPVVLGDLVPVLEEVRQGLSGNFWSAAAQPIRDLVNGLIPQLSEGLNGVAGSMGSLAAVIATKLQTSLGGGAFASVISNLRAAIEGLTPAISPIIDAFITLGATGSEYLPVLSAWLSRLSVTFNNFIQGAAADGSLRTWIDNGIEAFMALGSVIGSIGSILGGFYTAAEAAGGATLQTLAGGLERIADTVNGPVFQTGLTTIFKGAHAGMAGLGAALGPINSLFSALAPSIAHVLEVSGKLVGSVLGALASGLEKAKVGDSLVVMFDGISKGVEALLPHVPTLTAVFGQFLETVGKITAILGPIFGAAIEALAPVVSALLDAIIPVAEVLGGAFMSALQTVAPHIQTFAEKITSFVQNNPQLAATFVVVAGAIGAVASAIVGIIPSVLSFVGGAQTLFNSLGGGSTIVKTLGNVFRTLLGPVGLIIAALVTAYATSEPFREAINGLVGSLMGLVGSIMNEVAPVFNTLVALFMMIVNDAVVPLVTTLTTILIPVFDSLKPVIETVFGFIQSTITNVMTVVQGIIKVVTGLIKGDWSMVWTGIKDIFSGIWSQIKNIVTTAINLVKQIVVVGITALKVVWETIWNTIKNIVSAVWTGIKTVISGAWEGVKTIVGGGIDWVKTVVSNGFTWVRDTATNLWNGLKANIAWVWDHALKPIFNTVMNFIKKDVPKAFETGVNSIKTFWEKLKDIAKAPVKFMIDTVYNDGIRGVFNKVMDFIGSGKQMGKLSVPGFRTGGYTGDGGVNDVAGAVHGKEYVFTAEQTRAIGKDKLASIAASAGRKTPVEGAANNEGAAGGGNMGGYFMGNVGQISRHKAMYLNVAGGMAPWNFGGAASLWDGAAGVKVKVGRGQHQAQVNPLERGGGILGFSNNTHIDMSPSWMQTLGATQRRTVAAHEIGHSLGLPHNSSHSIMQPNLGQMAPTPTANDIANLQSLYPGGSGKAGSGESFNPLKWVAERITESIGNMLDKIPGAGKVLEMALDVAKKMIDIGKQWAIDKVTGHEGGDEGAARIGGPAKVHPTVFDGGGMLEQGMVGIHNKRVPDKVLTDSQWNTMKTIADNNNGSGHGIIEQNNTYHVTIDASTIKDVQHMKDIFDNLSQASRVGRGTPNARIA